MRPFLPPKQANFGTVVRALGSKAVTAATPYLNQFRTEGLKMFGKATDYTGRNISSGIQELNRQVRRIPGMDRGFLNRQAIRYLRDPRNQYRLGATTIGGGAGGLAGGTISHLIPDRGPEGVPTREVEFPSGYPGLNIDGRGRAARTGDHFPAPLTQAGTTPYLPPPLTLQPRP